jgi:hypothetical protein
VPELADGLADILPGVAFADKFIHEIIGIQRDGLQPLQYGIGDTVESDDAAAPNHIEEAFVASAEPVKLTQE